jgi:hypothetical protein
MESCEKNLMLEKAKFIRNYKQKCSVYESLTAACTRAACTLATLCIQLAPVYFEFHQHRRPAANTLNGVFEHQLY